MTNFKDLKVGDVLSETQYYKAEAISGNKVQLVNDNGDKCVVDSEYVRKSLSSAIQFESIEKVTKTRLAEIFLENSRVAMTVNYNKQVEQKAVVDGITEIYSNLTMGMTKEDFGKKVTKVLNLKGEERMMVGRHYGSHDINGRVHFIDMMVEKDGKKDYDTRQRLVDPRTLNYVIVNNVKYLIK